MSTPQGIHITFAIFSGATMLASLGVGIASFMKVKVHHDPVRHGLKWVAPALMFHFLGTALQFTGRILDLSRFEVGYRVTTRLGTMGGFFSFLATIGLFLALLELSLGILTMWHCAPKRVVGMRRTSWAIASLMLLLDVAYMIGSQVTAVGTLTYLGIFSIVVVTLECLNFVALCWVVAMMILVVKRSKANRNKEALQAGQKIVSLYYASVCVAWFGSFWFLVYLATILTTLYSARYTAISPAIVIETIKSLLRLLTPLIALTMLFVVGARREGGLWTNTLPK